MGVGEAGGRGSGRAVDAPVLDEHGDPSARIGAGAIDEGGVVEKERGHGGIMRGCGREGKAKARGETWFARSSDESLRRGLGRERGDVATRLELRYVRASATNSPNWRRCSPAVSKFDGSSQPSSADRTAGHSRSMMENHA